MFLLLSGGWGRGGGCWVGDVVVVLESGDCDGMIGGEVDCSVFVCPQVQFSAADVDKAVTRHLIFSRRMYTKRQQFTSNVCEKLKFVLLLGVYCKFRHADRPRSPVQNRRTVYFVGRLFVSFRCACYVPCGCGIFRMVHKV